MARFIFILLIFMQLAAIDVFSQGNAAYEKAAEAAVADENYRAAYTYYRFLYEANPDRLVYLYQFAENARLYKAYSLAAQGYQEVLDSSGAHDFPLARFWAGMVQKSLGNYEQAADHFARFLDERSDTNSITIDSFYLTNAADQIQQCTWARAEESRQSSPIDTVLYLDTISWKGINSEYSDLSPVWIGDTLFFSSTRFPNPGDRYESERPLTRIVQAGLDTGFILSEQGRPAVHIPQPDRVHIAHPAFSRDGQRIYFSRCAYTMGLKIRCAIYYIEFLPEQGTWSDTINAGASINYSGSNNAQPALGWDVLRQQEILYFSSNRPGGKGGMDLYAAPLDKRGKPLAASPLDALNTEGDDMTPFYDHHNQLLYFSSDGRPGLGGFDLYYSRFRYGAWRPVEHLGYPLNSSYDDNYLSVDSSGRMAFFTSNRPGVLYPDEEARTCCPDIFATHIDHVDVSLEVQPTVAGRFVLDSLNILLVNEDMGEQLIFYKVGKDPLRYELEKGFRYRLITHKVNYRSDTIFFSTMGIQSDTVLRPDIRLSPKLGLQVAAFDGVSGEPLQGFSAVLYGEDDVIMETFENQQGNIFVQNGIKPGTSYRICIEKEGYVPKCRAIKISSDQVKPQVFFITVNLLRSEIDTLALFFDNDRPGPRMRGKVDPEVHYEVNQQEYLQERYAEYVRQYTESDVSPCRGNYSEEELKEMEAFFKYQIAGNFERLEDYKRVLIHYMDSLEQGQQLVLFITGFASSSGASSYNKWLTDRRINSVKGLLERVFEKNLKTGNLRLETDSRSNRDALKLGVPGKKENRCRAQYGLGAIKARRVEIRGVVLEAGQELPVGADQ